MPRLSTSAMALVLAAGLVAPPALAGVPLSDVQLGATAAGIAFNIVNRVSDQSGVAPVTDPLLVNAWGLSQGPGTMLWVANNGSNTSTIYDPATFGKASLNVNVPGAPTGTTFVGVNGAFDISAGGKTGSTVFAFATEGGQIEGWSPNVDPNNAVVAFDGSGQGAEFKGLTLAGVVKGNPQLFAANFGQNSLQAFNTNFQPTATLTDPNLPQGYSPFNVQNLNGMLYATYAMRAPGAHDETAGVGLGIVDVFTTQGQFVQRLVTGGPLNAPWGLAIAPASFGQFAGALLVGNFGDGQINAFNPKTGAFLGQLNLGNSTNTIDGLWALRSGANGTLTFSAGPADEGHGLVGSIAPTGGTTLGSPMVGSPYVVGMAEMHH
jgi:uncharacterized protein (TIGR03118 family)